MKPITPCTVESTIVHLDHDQICHILREWLHAHIEKFNRRPTINLRIRGGADDMQTIEAVAELENTDFAAADYAGAEVRR